MIWGLLITSGESLMQINPNAREPLVTLARHLQASSNTSDSWGEGLLGAIGLKKDAITNKYDQIKPKNFAFQNFITMFSVPISDDGF